MVRIVESYQPRETLNHGGESDVHMRGFSDASSWTEVAIDCRRQIQPSNSD